MELPLRVVIFIESLIHHLLRPVFWYLNRNPKPRLPPIQNPLLKLSATVLAEKIRRREVSSETIVEAYIERIKEVNPLLNAVVEQRFEEALRDARFCDKQLEAGEVSTIQLEADQPLYGVPMTVKESCSVKGLSFTGCSLVRQGIKAHDNGGVVEAMRNAGAIPLCVTTTPELCLALETNNYATGKTNNPYDLRHTSGGSSGGEGALLGAGASLIGIGSDIAGSIRLPGLFNGVFGHKPSEGITSLDGHYPNSDAESFRKYLVIGPLTRYADDLSLAFKVMSGKHCEELRLNEPVDVQKLKVFYMEDAGESFGLVPTYEEIRKVIRAAGKYLGEHGANVRHIEIEELRESLEVSVALFFGMDRLPQFLQDPDDPKHEKNALLEVGKALIGSSPYTKQTIFMSLLRDINALIPRAKLQDYKDRAEKLRNKFLELLGDDGVFLYPTFVRSTPYHNTVNLQIAGVVYCIIFNILGFPSTHVPMGLNDKGLPVGLQVVATTNQDRLCLAVAKELEKGFGGWVPPS